MGAGSLFGKRISELRGRGASPTGRRWLGFLLGLAALAVVVLAVARRAEERAAARLLQEAHPAWLAAALALQAATYLAQGEVFRVVLHRAGEVLSLARAFRLSVAKLFVDQVLPSAGLSGVLLVAHALERHGVSRSAVVSAVVVNTISYVAANAIGIGVALAMLDARGRTSPALLAASAAFVLTVSMLAVLLFRLTRPGAWPPRRLTRLGPVPRALKLLRRARPHLVRSRALLAYCTSLQLAILLLDAGTVGVLIQALGHSPSPSGVFVSFMVSTLVRLIVPIPGGLGAFEAASVGALSLTGVKLSVALAATLLFRVLSFWLPMVPGLWLSHREGRPARGSPPGRTRRATRGGPAPAPGALPGSGSRGTPTGRRARG